MPPPDLPHPQPADSTVRDAEISRLLDVILEQTDYIKLLEAERDKTAGGHAEKLAAIQTQLENTNRQVAELRTLNESQLLELNQSRAAHDAAETERRSLQEALRALELEKQSLLAEYRSSKEAIATLLATFEQRIDSLLRAQTDTTGHLDTLLRTQTNMTGQLTRLAATILETPVVRWPTLLRQWLRPEKQERTRSAADDRGHPPIL